MKKIKSLSVSLLLIPLLTIIFAHASAMESMAADAFKVSIGSSTWRAKDAYSHDVTRKAISSGQKRFMVSSSANESFEINLSEKQVEDILAGSTVVVTTETGNKKVKIGPKKKKAVKSGW